MSYPPLKHRTGNSKGWTRTFSWKHCSMFKWLAIKQKILVSVLALWLSSLLLWPCFKWEAHAFILKYKVEQLIPSLFHNYIQLHDDFVFSGEDCEFSPMMADSQDTENLCCDLKCKKQAGAICAKGMVCP